MTTTPSEARVKATIHAVFAAIRDNAQTEGEAMDALMSVLAAKLVDLGVPAPRAAQHFQTAMEKAWRTQGDDSRGKVH
tara:strand:+ start:897 stop:1130 length:234 start_codon:yes stop_codon:yes gene_type:complete